MSDNEERQISVGHIRTDYLKGSNDDRLYNIGGARGLNLTSIPFLSNGLSMRKVGLFLGIYAIWAIPLFIIGIGYKDFGSIGAVIHFFPPGWVIYKFFSKAKESTLTTGQQIGFTLRRFFREGSLYRGTKIMPYRGRTKIRFTMLTAPGATHGPRAPKH